jgi:addiction module HigA family antidote
MSKLEPITPGEILSEEFLIPMGLSQYRLAKEIGVPAQRISEIVAGKRAITADTDLRLCRFLGLSNGYWLRAQAAYDTEVAQRTLGPLLEKIKPWSAQGPNKCCSDARLRGLSSVRRMRCACRIVALTVRAQAGASAPEQHSARQACGSPAVNLACPW